MLIYDLEIIRSPKIDPKRPNYAYAKDWDDHIGMGIACIGVYNYATGDLFCQRVDLMGCSPDFADMSEYGKLIRTFQDADLVIGYNNQKFDDPMMKSHGYPIVPYKSYDLLVNIYAAVGLYGAWDYHTHAGYNLDAVCKANGIEGKSGNGADAPFEWQDGKFEHVMEYCKNDVWITKLLIDKVFRDGGLISPKTGKFVRISMPFVE